MTGRPSDEVAQRNESIIQLFLDGIPTKDVASQYNLSLTTVDIIVQEARAQREAEILAFLQRPYKNLKVLNRRAREKFNLTPAQIRYRRKQLA